MGESSFNADNELPSELSGANLRNGYPFAFNCLTIAINIIVYCFYHWFVCMFV